MRHHESLLQCRCVYWFKLQYRLYALLLYAIPNGGKRNSREAARLREEGVTAGVADLFLSIPNQHYHGLYIEMKCATGGRQSHHQKLFQEAVEQQGYRYVIIRSLEDFILEIKSYLGESENSI